MKISDILLRYKPKYLNLPVALRWVLKILATVLFVCGVVLLIPLPEVGIPLIAITLSLLSYEYGWADRLLKTLLTFFSRPLVRRVMVAAAVIIAAVILLYVLKTYHKI